jgi:hypothetical protein
MNTLPFHSTETSAPQFRLLVTGAVVLLPFLLWMQPANGDMFACRKGQGVTLWRNAPCEEGEQLIKRKTFPGSQPASREHADTTNRFYACKNIHSQGVTWRNTTCARDETVLLSRSFTEREGIRPAKMRTENVTQAYDAAIRMAAKQHQVNPHLVKAIIRAESNFDPRAISPKGAMGLMQLMPDTAKQYGLANRSDPLSNIYAGTEHLSRLLDKFDGDLTLALAAYNAGENAVTRYGNRIPPYDETREYVDRVLKYYDSYRTARARE